LNTKSDLTKLRDLLPATRHSLKASHAGDIGSGPDFICFGQAKAGTAWLFDQMKACPDVWMPPVKEINFLNGSFRKPANRKAMANGGVKMKTASIFGELYNLNWYRQYFDPKGDRKSGDISPSYSNLSSKKIALAASGLPHTRLIYLLREPTSRLWSHLCMDVRTGRRNAEELTSGANLTLGALV
jgi:hypothetical protein